MKKLLLHKYMYMQLLVYFAIVATHCFYIASTTIIGYKKKFWWDGTLAVLFREEKQTSITTVSTAFYK